MGAQTPQAFDVQILKRMPCRVAVKEEVTDDAALFEKCYGVCCELSRRETNLSC